ncbi:Round spermatid basic protein 1 [Liparis tanakae]|uniref:Round spermatid basic protein 1 n=1 Tax=Liparis tanakae TaxID=230148 RepID=A0A4Z2EXT0_9TELE|nr:Round spermatid basic protein 1 [Liparis tanakae]
MAAQVDLLRAKVEGEQVRGSLHRFIRERKKKKKRDMSPLTAKREKSADEEKKVKLHQHHQHHHLQHGAHRTYQPQQLQQHPKPHKFSADKHVPHSHQHPYQHPYHHRGFTHLQPCAPPPPPPRRAPEQRRRKPAVLPEPPALFTLTPVRVVKAKPPGLKDKHRDKDLKLKKENTEANVKHAELKKKKEPRPHNENAKSLTLEEYLLKKRKKKKKKHREDEHGTQKLRYVHNKAVQTVCAGLGADLTPPARSGRDPVGNQQAYLRALKPGLVPFLSHQDHYIRSSCLQTGTWCGRFMHEERQANGGGSVLHAYADEIACLGPAEMERFSQEFLQLAFAETHRGAASYALAVVHSAAAFMPDFLDYFAFNFPNTPVKMEMLGKKDIETTTIANFHSQVSRTYCSGTYRSGPMRQISLVGAVDEEVGNYFPEFLDMLEESPFLKVKKRKIFILFLNHKYSMGHPGGGECSVNPF